VFDLFATVLAWFYSFTQNYALAIALLTLCVMVILTPLTLKGTKSMLQMQRLQPEIRRLQQQHKGDRQKLNEELMKVYQEHKINPLGGCLPLLLQAPVFIVLYRVLSKLTADTNGDGFFDPSYLDPSTDLYQDLSRSTEMLSFGIDLSKSAVSKLSDSFVSGIPYLILILLVAGTSYYQQRQISARNAGQAADTPMLRQQQMLMKIFPIFFAVISLTLPAGLVVYFLVSNSYRIAQQAYITHSFYKDEQSLGRQATAAAAQARAEAKESKDGKAAPAAKAASGGSKPAPKAPPPRNRPTSGRTTPPKARPTPSGRVTPPKTKTTGRPAPSRPNPKKK
jgi:YidC/Oxa1 family membrane protein insertase